MLEMEADFDVEKARLTAKVNELTVALGRARSQVIEKERIIDELKVSSTQPQVLLSADFILIEL